MNYTTFALIQGGIFPIIQELGTKTRLEISSTYIYTSYNGGFSVQFRESLILGEKRLTFEFSHESKLIEVFRVTINEWDEVTEESRAEPRSLVVWANLIKELQLI